MSIEHDDIVNLIFFMMEFVNIGGVDLRKNTVPKMSPERYNEVIYAVTSIVCS